MITTVASDVVTATAPAGWTQVGQTTSGKTTSTIWQRVAIGGDAGSSVKVTYSAITKATLSLFAYKQYVAMLTYWLQFVHSCSSRRRIVSPAPPSNSTLSGTTTAARPPILSIERMCCTKLSCLLDVVAQKSSRTTV